MLDMSSGAMMPNTRLEKLRQIEAAATEAPWMLPTYVREVWRDTGTVTPAFVASTNRGTDPERVAPADADRVLIATARNILPATIELLELLLSAHKQIPIHDLGCCAWCSVPFPCPERRAALAVLDRIRDDDA